MKKIELKLQLFEKKDRYFKVTNTLPLPSQQPKSQDASRNCLFSPYKTPHNNSAAKL